MEAPGATVVCEPMRVFALILHVLLDHRQSVRHKRESISLSYGVGKHGDGGTHRESETVLSLAMYLFPRRCS